VLQPSLSTQVDLFSRLSGCVNMLTTLPQGNLKQTFMGGQSKKSVLIAQCI